MAPSSSCTPWPNDARRLQQARSSDDGGSVTGFLRIIACNSAMIFSASRAVLDGGDRKGLCLGRVVQASCVLSQVMAPRKARAPGFARPLSLADAGKWPTCRLIARPLKGWFPEIAPQGSCMHASVTFGFEPWEVRFELCSSKPWHARKASRRSPRTMPALSTSLLPLHHKRLLYATVLAVEALLFGWGGVLEWLRLRCR